VAPRRREVTLDQATGERRPGLVPWMGSTRRAGFPRFTTQAQGYVESHGTKDTGEPKGYFPFFPACLKYGQPRALAMRSKPLLMPMMAAAWVMLPQ